jgi:hypothetical protein
MRPTSLPLHRNTDDDKLAERRTVIPTPRANGMFPGWGVRF